MKYTVHQPMIFPPIYLWARFASVSKLVLLGTDWTKPDGWHTRFQLNLLCGSVMIPVALKNRFGKMINEVEFADQNYFFKKLGKTLKYHYGSEKYFALVTELIQPAEMLTFGQYCSQFIRKIAKYLDLSLEIIDIEDLAIPRPQNASKWLAQIGKKIGGDVYVCAADATGKYLDVAPFIERDILLQKQMYTLKLPIPSHTSILELLLRYSPAEIWDLLQ